MLFSLPPETVPCPFEDSYSSTIDNSRHTVAVKIKMIIKKGIKKGILRNLAHQNVKISEILEKGEKKAIIKTPPDR
jgi:hypothetical protein